MLKEKIGQMLLMGFKGVQVNENDPITRMIMQKQIGGVILFAKNILHPQQLSELAHSLREKAQEAGMPHFFIALDYEGGTVERLSPKNGFPETLTAEALGMMDNAVIANQAREMAATLKNAGINLNFAPTVDVNINPDNPIIGKRGRSFSADAKRVAECAAIFTRAYLEAGILCAYKHFPGHGSSTGDSHLGFVDVTHSWRVPEIQPYQQLLSVFGDKVAVMMSHVVHHSFDRDGFPASLSRRMTHDLLREKLNFDGLIVSDDLQMKAITDHYGVADAARYAINAGVDLLIFGNQLVSEDENAESIINQIYADVLLHRIPETRIEESYKRLQRVGQGIDFTNNESIK